MRKSKVIAGLMVCVMVLGVVQTVFGGTLPSEEPEGYGAIPHVIMTVAGGIVGFFAGGVLGAVVGAGFMAVVYPTQGCPGCQDIGGPVY